MKSTAVKSKKKFSPTQEQLDINEIKEGVLVMRDGTLRAGLLVSSINFALKSEEEQNAIIGAYVSFINNLDFPFQIAIQSRELNIDGYLDKMRQKAKEQTNDLLKVQTNEYIRFVQEFITAAKIMNKRFYVTVMYNPLSDKQKHFFSRLLEIFKPVGIFQLKEDRFYKRKSELDRRVANVSSGLASIGLNAVQLDTQGLIELFYTSYNPDTSQNQPLADVKELRLAE